VALHFQHLAELDYFLRESTRRVLWGRDRVRDAKDVEAHGTVAPLFNPSPPLAPIFIAVYRIRRARTYMRADMVETVKLANPIAWKPVEVAKSTT